MKQIIFIRRQFILNLLILSLFACSTTLLAKKTSMANVAPRKAMAKLIPGGISDNWRYLGTSQDSSIIIEINESSISRKAAIATFQDRKTFLHPILVDQFANNLSTTPQYKYKYSLSWWYINCQLQQFAIVANELYDNFGHLLHSQSFTDQEWATILAGSISQQQYAYICQGLNRNLGY